MHGVTVFLAWACREGAAARASLLRRKTAHGMKTAQTNQQQQPGGSLPGQQPHPAPSTAAPTGQQSTAPLIPERRRGRPKKSESAAAVAVADSPDATNSPAAPDSLAAPGGLSGSHSRDPTESLSERELESVKLMRQAFQTYRDVDGGGTPVKRRGRPRKTPVDVQVVPASGPQPQDSTSSANSPGELREVPAEILQQRIAGNPREHPKAGDDNAYD